MRSLQLATRGYIPAGNSLTIAYRGFVLGAPPLPRDKPCLVSLVGIFESLDYEEYAVIPFFFGFIPVKEPISLVSVKSEPIYKIFKTKPIEFSVTVDEC